MFACTLFDYNGVLIDDERVHLAAFQAVLEPLGIALSEADYWEKYLGFDDVGAFSAVLAAHGRSDDALVAELVRAKFPHYMERAQAGLTAFEGAAELVRACSAFGPVGVVSGALRPEIELGLQVLGVTNLIEFVVAAEDCESSKPDPEGYLKGLELLRKHVRAPLDPAAVLVIEDSLSGIQAAKSAGLTCAAVAHSYPESELEAAGADDVVAKLGDLNDARLAQLAERALANPS